MAAQRQLLEVLAARVSRVEGRHETAASSGSTDALRGVRAELDERTAELQLRLDAFVIEAQSRMRALAAEVAEVKLGAPGAVACAELAIARPSTEPSQESAALRSDVAAVRAEASRSAEDLRADLAGFRVDLAGLAGALRGNLSALQDRFEQRLRRQQVEAGDARSLREASIAKISEEVGHFEGGLRLDVDGLSAECRTLRQGCDRAASDVHELRQELRRELGGLRGELADQAAAAADQAAAAEARIYK